MNVRLDAFPWAIFGAIMPVLNALFKPKLRLAARHWQSTPPLPGSAAGGTWYVTDLLVFNDGHKDAVNGGTLTLCLPPSWGVASSPGTSRCDALSTDSELPGWARFRISFDSPFYRGTPREERYLKIAFAARPSEPIPSDVKWRFIYEGGANPRRGYHSLTYVQ